MNLSDRLWHYRQVRELSLSRLAREAGVSKGYLWELENPRPGVRQRPSARTLRALAQVVGRHLGGAPG